MPLWTLTSPPKHVPNCEATPQGWVDPQTGEIIVAIRQLAEKAGPASVRSVSFGALSYEEGEALSVSVYYGESVDVLAGAEILVSNDNGPDIVLVAAEQLGVTEVIFDGDVAPLAGDVLSIAAQSIVGDIKDAGTSENSSLVISAPIALAAGEREVQAA
jgi:hypothetical protein